MCNGGWRQRGGHYFSQGEVHTSYGANINELFEECSSLFLASVVEDLREDHGVVRGRWTGESEEHGLVPVCLGMELV